VFHILCVLQFTTPGGTALLQPNIFITVLGVASTVSYRAKHVSYPLLSICSRLNQLSCMKVVKICRR